MRIEPREPPRWRLRSVAALLQRGGVIAYPTEGVWGLGCLPSDEDAVARILALKQRHVSKGLILVAGDMAVFAPLLEGLTADELARLEAAWPGHHTFLVPHRHRVPPWIHGSSDRVALRVSAHPLVAALAAHAGSPLVSTSANPAGRAPALTALRVRQYFRRGIDAVVPGELGGADGPSSITDLRAMTLVRAAS